MCIAPASNQSSDFTAFIAMTVSVRAGQVRICYHGPCSNSLHAHCPSGHPPRPVGPSPMFLLSVREWLWRCLVLLRAAAHSHHCPLFICHCHHCSLFICRHCSAITLFIVDLPPLTVHLPLFTFHMSVSTISPFSASAITVHLSLWSLFICHCHRRSLLICPVNRCSLFIFNVCHCSLSVTITNSHWPSVAVNAVDLNTLRLSLCHCSALFRNNNNS